MGWENAPLVIIPMETALLKLNWIVKNVRDQNCLDTCHVNIVETMACVYPNLIPDRCSFDVKTPRMGSFLILFFIGMPENGAFKK